MKKLDIACSLAKGGEKLRGHNIKENSDYFLKSCYFLKNITRNLESTWKQHQKFSHTVVITLKNNTLQGLRKLILKSIEEEIEKQCFSIIGGETLDLNHHEQISKNSFSKKNCSFSGKIKGLKVKDAETIFETFNSTLNGMSVSCENVLTVHFDQDAG